MVEIFGQKPKSYKMVIDSQLASNLKSCVSKTLPHFLKNHAKDDVALVHAHVLSEYIIVLVCNGKSQYQARDELEPFLGQSTTPFVSWLWGHLSQNVQSVNATIGSSDFENGNDSSSSGGYDVDTKPIKGRTRGHWYHFSGGHEDSPTEEKKHTGLLIDNSSEDETVFGGFEEWYPSLSNSLNKVYMEEEQAPTSRIKSPEMFGTFENDYCESNSGSFGVRASVGALSGREKNMEYEKITGYKGLPHEPSHSSDREPFSRNNQSLVSEERHVKRLTNVAGRRLFAVAARGAIFNQNSRPRGNVWDRLGKLTKDDTRSTGNRTGRPETGNGGRKRQLSDISPDSSSASSCFGDEETSTKYRGSLSENYRSESNANRDTATAGLWPMQAQLVDVKLRLHHIETEVSNLQLKQVDMKNEGNYNLLSASGSLRHPKEEIGSRTIFVTNVHFAATREALRSYFSKCGLVTGVIKLTDTATDQQRGSAYITFASKDSVDKALKLVETSFFSQDNMGKKRKQISSDVSSCGPCWKKKLNPSSKSANI